MTYLLCAVLLISFQCSQCHIFNLKRLQNLVRRRDDQNQGLDHYDEIPSDSEPKHLITIKFLKQRVDHFNASNHETWHSRFMENKIFFQYDAPVYIRVGGFEPFINDYLMGGFIYDLAKSTNGSMIATEHRYYGSSNTHTNLTYLHSTQTLEDLRNLVERIKKTYGYQGSKVVLIGNDYGGSLAVWMAQMYPNLIHAVVANSPLLKAKIELLNKQRLEQIFKNAPQTCTDQILAVFKQYYTFIENGQYDEVVRIANVCPNVDLSKVYNQHLLFQSELSFLMQSQEEDPSHVTAFCKQFSSTHNIHNQNKTQNQKGSFHPKKMPHNRPCLNIDFDYLIKLLKSEQYKDVKHKHYQMCNEFGWFPTTTMLEKPFNQMVPYKFYKKFCESLFGDILNITLLQERVDETNRRYRGLEPVVNNAIIVNGELDPWNFLGIPDQSKNLTGSMIVVNMPDQSRSSLLKPYEDTDSQSLRATREIIIEKVKIFLRKEPIGKSIYRRIRY